MDDKVFDKYLLEMSIVRHRINRVQQVISRWRGKTVSISRTRVEAVALQARLTCEGVILAGAHANAETYGNIFKKIENEWQLSRIIKIMSNTNQFFVPLPCKYGRKPSGESYISAKKQNAVPIEDIERFHGKMASLLHHRHSNRDPIDSSEIVQNIMEMNSRLKLHLREHTILIPMGEVTSFSKMRAFVVRMHFHRKRPVEGWDISLEKPDVRAFERT